MSDAVNDVAIVPVWSIWCHGCGRRFEWQATDPNDNPPSWHSRQCGRRRRAALLEQMPRKCPRPNKRVWPSMDAAAAAGSNEIRPYRCICGGIHLGHVKAEIVRYVIIEPGEEGNHA